MRQLTTEEAHLRRDIILALKKESGNYSEIAGRDLCDIVDAVVSLIRTTTEDEDIQKFGKN